MTSSVSDSRAPAITKIAVDENSASKAANSRIRAVHSLVVLLDSGHAQYKERFLRQIPPRARGAAIPRLETGHIHEVWDGEDRLASGLLGIGGRQIAGSEMLKKRHFPQKPIRLFRSMRQDHTRTGKAHVMQPLH